MKLATLTAVAALLVIGAVIVPITEANAVVCARGVYRAGCAGPRGAVVTRRPVVRPHYRRPVVIHRGPVVRRRIY